MNSLKNQVIVDDNIMYVYFEVIKMICPDSILDFGPFLKRTGCISRQAKSAEIQKNVKLYGVDFLLDKKVLVYKNIYDELFPSDNWRQELEKKLPQKIDLAIALKIKDIVSDKAMEDIFDYAADNSKILFTDNFYSKYANRYKDRVRRITIEAKEYYLYSFMDL